MPLGAQADQPPPPSTATTGAPGGRARKAGQRWRRAAHRRTGWSGSAGIGRPCRQMRRARAVGPFPGYPSLTPTGDRVFALEAILRPRVSADRPISGTVMGPTATGLRRRGHPPPAPPRRRRRPTGRAPASTPSSPAPRLPWSRPAPSAPRGTGHHTGKGAHRSHGTARYRVDLASHTGHAHPPRADQGAPDPARARARITALPAVVAGKAQDHRRTHSAEAGRPSVPPLWGQ